MKDLWLDEKSKTILQYLASVYKLGSAEYQASYDTLITQVFAQSKNLSAPSRNFKRLCQGMMTNKAK